MTDIWEEEAERQRQEAEREDRDERVQALRTARTQADFDKGVRLGWWDAEGNILVAETDEDDEADSEDEEA
jgi:hypothetical protein